MNLPVLSDFIRDKFLPTDSRQRKAVLMKASDVKPKH